MKHAAAVAIGSSPFVTFGALQVLGAAQAPQWSAIADDFLNLRFWLTLSIVLIAGAFGGVSYELLLRKGAIELPHRVRCTPANRRRYSYSSAQPMIALGIVGRAIVGASAAAAALMVISPTSAHGAVALGVAAGAAAPALIRLMRKQLLFAADLMSRVQADGRVAESHAEIQAEQSASTRAPRTLPAPAVSSAPAA